MDHLIKQYFDINLAHLLDDELQNELIVRKIEFGTESRSVLERRLRAQLKEERESKVTNFEYEKGWEELLEELESCHEKIQEIKQILENRTAKSVPDQKFKSRLLHLFFRMLRAKAHTTEESEINTIGDLAGHCAKLLENYFSPISPFEEIRAAETKIINSSLLQIRDKLDEEKDPTENNNQKNPNPNPYPPSPREEDSELRVDNDDDEEDEEESEDNRTDKGEGDDERDRVLGRNQENNSEIIRLRQANVDLKLLVDELLDRLHKLEAEKVKPNEPTKNSTQFNKSNDSNLNEQPKPKFCYKEFLDWLVKDQKLDANENKASKENVPKKQFFSKPLKQSSSDNDGSVVEVIGKRLPVHKWKVRYDGADGGRRLNEFLKEVEFNARSEGFNDQELYNSAHHLFIGKARSWFIEINSNNELKTWENVVKELKQEFLPPDLDYFYERQLHTRKQGNREKFQDYYHDMIRLFGNLTIPMDQERKFQIIFRNSKAEYKSAMLAAGIKTIPKMKEFGKNFDAINWQWFAKNEKEIPRGTRTNDRQINEINSERKNERSNTGSSHNNNRPWNKGENFTREFRNSNRPNPSYRNVQNKQNPPTKPQNTNQNGPEQKPSQTFKQPDEQKAGPSSNLNSLEKILKSYVPLRKGTCFNCHNFGHNFYQCNQEKQIFCEECGFPGFFKRDCPYCPTKNSEKTAQ